MYIYDKEEGNSIKKIFIKLSSISKNRKAKIMIQGDIRLINLSREKNFIPLEKLV